MKATGIVRRVDDLGRIVIPKEIRRTLGRRAVNIIDRQTAFCLRSWEPGTCNYFIIKIDFTLNNPIEFRTL